MRRPVLLALGLAFALCLGLPEADAQAGGSEKRSITLDKETDAQFRDLILRRVNLLTQYISRISDKSVESDERDLAITNAVKLFAQPQANTVEVSSTNRPTSEYPVRVYFRRLKAIQASRVDIDFYDVAKISDLQQGPDGLYYGTATIYQRSRLYNSDGQLTYEDETTKRIDVVIEKREQFDREIFVVKLGNIYVTETR